jgi:hypothetical protein
MPDEVLSDGARDAGAGLMHGGHSAVEHQPGARTGDRYGGDTPAAEDDGRGDADQARYRLLAVERHYGPQADTVYQGGGAAIRVPVGCQKSGPGRC